MGNQIVWAAVAQRLAAAGNPSSAMSMHMKYIIKE
jgi:hypothetical protein